MPRDFDYDRQFQDGSPQDYTTPPENKETESQNPYTEAGYKTGDVVLYDWGNGRLEGGFGHRALDDILGSEIAQKYKIGDYRHYDGARSLVENGKADSVREFFQIQYAKNPKNYIITANTPYEKNGKPLDDTRYEMFNGNKLYYKHAYSVTGFSGNEVQLANPHDTKEKITMDMANFLNFFSQLSYVEIQAKYEK